MKKALIVATVGRFLDFERNDIRILQSLGYEVHCAANFRMQYRDDFEQAGIIKHQVDFVRSPFSIHTIESYNQLKKILCSDEYNIIHCHTPVAGILGRLCAQRFRKNGTKVLYTAHGFHFFKGAPINSWLLYYPVEWLCSWFSDVVITINQEDYCMAKDKFHAKRVAYIPGVGIDLQKFKRSELDICAKRETLGLSSEDRIVLSVGELSKRKNHKAVIRAIAEINDKKIKYIICGCGALESELRKTAADCGISEQVLFLGYRNDINELCQIADLFVLPSLQEGLPVALMEAMACQVPVVCSRIRGNTDLVKNKKLLFSPYNHKEIVEAISYALYSCDGKDTVLDNTRQIQLFTIENVGREMKAIYSECCEE